MGEIFKAYATLLENEFKRLEIYTPAGKNRYDLVCVIFKRQDYWGMSSTILQRCRHWKERMGPEIGWKLW